MILVFLPRVTGPENDRSMFPGRPSKTTLELEQVVIIDVSRCYLMVRDNRDIVLIVIGQLQVESPSWHRRSGDICWNNTELMFPVNHG